MSTSQELLAEWTVTPAKVSEAVRLLVQGAQPRKIIMFGSQARRGAREQSDVDLMVVTGPLEKDARWRETARLREILAPIQMPIDLIVVPEDELEYWRDTPGNVYYEATLDGRVLYEQVA